LTACTAAYGTRYRDGALDMGTGYDCFDALAHPDAEGVNAEARSNRALLARLMRAHGFQGIDSEWWHFTLGGEPFPDRAFDFDVAAP